MYVINAMPTAQIVTNGGARKDTIAFPNEVEVIAPGLRVSASSGAHKVSSKDTSIRPTVQLTTTISRLILVYCIFWDAETPLNF
jgi:hypothetical protein